jgi:uncharacterized membrane-anchored protein YitT (DUF2179 family)
VTSNTIHAGTVDRPSRHKAIDDAQALVTGALLAAVGISLFQQAGLLSGGTVGLALALSYGTGWNLSLALLLCNAPFYALACLRMGFEFTAKTLVAVALTALFLQAMPALLAFSHVSRLGAAVVGGLLAGIGILFLFRHRASLGGFNVVAVYCQEKLGWSAGKVQLALDALVLAGGAVATGASLATVASSVLAGVVLNLVLMVNHRPGRYVGSP